MSTYKFNTFPYVPDLQQIPASPGLHSQAMRRTIRHHYQKSKHPFVPVINLMVSFNAANISSRSKYPQVNSCFKSALDAQAYWTIGNPRHTAQLSKKPLTPRQMSSFCCDSCSDSDNSHFPQGFQSTKADNSFVKGLCAPVRQGHTA